MGWREYWTNHAISERKDLVQPVTIRYELRIVSFSL
jgi:hypothetical protein